MAAQPGLQAAHGAQGQLRSAGMVIAVHGAELAVEQAFHRAMLT
jgi:hypothetical protein